MGLKIIVIKDTVIINDIGNNLSIDNNYFDPIQAIVQKQTEFDNPDEENIELGLSEEEAINFINEEKKSNKYTVSKYSSELKTVKQKGEIADVEIRIESRGFDALFDFGWVTQSEAMHIGVNENELLEKAKNADYVIYCGGLDHSFDTEGIDRQNMNLPLEQNVTISNLASANPNTVVVITAGSPVEMPWIDNVNAVLWGWYAGMDGGNALADILSGKIVPSGKMPFTLP